VAVPDADLGRQREVVDAFFAAARAGNFEALVSVLDPDVVARTDAGATRPALSSVLRGAETVAKRAMSFARPSAVLRPVLVNGAAGVVVTINDRPVSIIGFTVVDGKVVAIDALADTARIRRLDLSALSA
jgi:RNA polymerase sigma-70 factor (ECF subfamily)